MKRLISFCLICSIMLCYIPMTLNAAAPVYLYEDFDYDLGMFTSADAESLTSKGFAAGWSSPHLDQSYAQIVQTQYGKALQMTAKGVAQYDLTSTLPEAFDHNADKDYYFSYIAYVENSGNMSGMYTQKVQIRDVSTYAGIMYDATNGIRPIIRWGSAQYPVETNSVLSRGNYYRVVFKYHATSGADYASIMVFPAGEDASANWDMTTTLTSSSLTWNSNVFTISTGTSSNINHSIGDLKIDIYDADEQMKNKAAEDAVSAAYALIRNGASASGIRIAIAEAEDKVLQLQKGISKDIQFSAIARLECYCDLVEQMENALLALEVYEGVNSLETTVDGLNSDLRMKNYLSGRLSVVKAYNSAVTAYETALNSRSQSDISTAKTLVEAVTDLGARSRLLHKLDVLMADIAVAYAESTKEAEDIDAAVVFINQLSDSVEKVSLLVRIEILLQAIAGDVAEEKVIEAEEKKTVATLEVARQWVTNLEDGSAKTAMTQRLDAVEQYINTCVPSISNVRISGTPSVGNVVSVAYDMTDLTGNSDEPNIKWAVGSSVGGVFTNIDNTGNTLLLTTDYTDKFIKVTVTPMNIIRVSGESISAVFAVIRSAKILYEDFNYTESSKLNGNSSALCADSAKGFSSGWANAPDLTGAVNDNFTVGKDKAVESTTATSAAIYRGMQNALDTSKNGLYYITWKMRLNSAATSIKDRNQKFVLTPRGISTAASQLNFGFIAERQASSTSTKHYSPYVRLGSALSYIDEFIVTPGQMYQMVVRMETSEDDADKVKFQLYPVGEALKPVWDLDTEAYLSSVFDTVGYATYTSGTAANAFGDLVIEWYNDTEKNLVWEIESLIAQGKNELSASMLTQAQTKLAGLPEGALQLNLQAQKGEALAFIEAQSQLVIALENDIAQILSKEVTLSNYQSILSDVAEIEARMEAVSSIVIKYGLEEKILSAKNKVSPILMQITRSEETFNYASGTMINSIPGNLQDGWSNGYFANSTLTVPVADTFTIQSTNAYTFTSEHEIYRGFAYPVEYLADKSYYMSWQSKLENGGVSYIKLGDLELGISSKPYIKIGNAKTEANVVISANTSYTMIAQINQGKVTMYTMPSGEGYDGKTAVTEEYAPTQIGEAIGFGGNRSTIWRFVKEEADLTYVTPPVNAMQVMISTISLSDIEAAASSANLLVSSIVKDLVLGCADRFRVERQNLMPIILSVGIRGSNKVGSQLEANYSILDTASNLMNVEVKWYAGGGYASTGQTLTVTSAHEGKSIYCEVTVYNDVGKASTPVKSSSVTISSSQGTVSGGTGAGFGGSVKIPDPIYFETPNTETAQTIQFADTENHWAKDAIIRMYEKGIVNGKSENAFNPDDNITRAEFTALLMRALGFENHSDSIQFNDVTDNMWYYEVVSIASGVGLVSGYDGNFYPEKNLNREEMAKMVVEAYKIATQVEVASKEVDFTDMEQFSDWSVTYVKQAYNLNLINGMEDGRYAPRESATRAQAVVIVERLLNL